MVLLVEIMFDNKLNELLVSKYTATDLAKVDTNRFRPHLTLGLYDNSFENQLKEVIKKYSSYWPVDIKLSSFGIFPNNKVFFIAPEWNKGLLQIRQSWNQYIESADIKLWEECAFKADSWVPHVTLLKNYEYQQVRALLESFELPACGEAIGIQMSDLETRESFSVLFK